MKRLLSALLAAAFIFAAIPSYAHWTCIATSNVVSHGYWQYYSYKSMDRAKQLALNACQTSPMVQGKYTTEFFCHDPFEFVCHVPATCQIHSCVPSE